MLVEAVATFTSSETFILLPQSNAKAELTSVATASKSTPTITNPKT